MLERNGIWWNKIHSVLKIPSFKIPNNYVFDLCGSSLTERIAMMSLIGKLSLQGEGNNFFFSFYSRVDLVFHFSFSMRCIDYFSRASIRAPGLAISVKRKTWFKMNESSPHTSQKCNKTTKNLGRLVEKLQPQIVWKVKVGVEFPLLYLLSMG